VVRLCDSTRISYFDYLYMIVMVLYMAQMDIYTSRMVGGLSAPWIPFLIPFLLTIYLVFKKKVSFNRNWWFIVVVCLLWAVMVTIKNKLYSNYELSFQFFLFYSIFFAYVHVQAFGVRIFSIYETIIVFFCKISLVFWFVYQLVPNLTFDLLPSVGNTNLGHNIFYMYNCIDPHVELENVIHRNSGCTWEPGRFAVMVCLALLCNLLRNGVSFKNNPNVLWLLVTLVTTFSTTGYCTALILYFIFSIDNIKKGRTILWVVLMVILSFFIANLDFVGEKIESQLNAKENLENNMDNIEWNNQNSREGYVGSFDRFTSMYIEWMNFSNDPILGYGRNTKNSYFEKNITKLYSTPNGLVKVLSMHGLLLGLFFYYLLFKSSRTIGTLFPKGRKYALLALLVASSMSYVLFSVPVITAFWLFGYFYKDEGLWIGKS